MKKLTILIVMGLLCLFVRVSGQSLKPLKALKVGDTIPDLVIQNIYNYKSKSIRLTEFKDKLLILDFWSTVCAPCIDHLPQIYSIQQKYKSQVFILPVDDYIRDTPEKVKRFMDLRKTAFNLPTVLLDTILHNLFRPRAWGVHVWIKNNVVKAITASEDVTESNILKMINVGVANLTQINTENFNFQGPFPINGFNGGPPPEYIFRSMLTHNMKGVFAAHVMFRDSLERINRIAIYGSTKRQLLVYAHPEFQHFTLVRTKINVKDTTDFPSLELGDSLSNTKRYDYEAIFPPASEQSAYRYFQQDLERYLPYIIDSVKLKDSVWVLKLSGKNKLKVKGLGPSESNIFHSSGLPVYFNDLPVSLLAYNLQIHFMKPVLDETGELQNVWLTLPNDLGNTKALIQSLEKQGIRLTREPREIYYAMISDRGSSN